MEFVDGVCVLSPFAARSTSHRSLYFHSAELFSRVLPLRETFLLHSRFSSV